MATNGQPEASGSAASAAASASPPGVFTCRLCNGECTDGVDIFSEEGRKEEVPDKCQRCLPVLITEDDDLSKRICRDCLGRLDATAVFFDNCVTTTKQQLRDLRRRLPSPLDLQTHVGQFVRSFNEPVVPQIKIEPGSLCSMNMEEQDDELNAYLDDYDASEKQEYFDEEEYYNYDEDEGELEDIKPILRLQGHVVDEEGGEVPFEIPASPPPPPRVRGRLRTLSGPLPDYTGTAVKRVRRVKPPGEPQTSPSSAERKKQVVPESLLACAECGETFEQFLDNLQHWKEKHPGKKPFFKCLEYDCMFTSNSKKKMYKHRARHRRSRRPREGTLLHTDKNERCEICGNSYPRSYLRTRHMLIHSDKKDFECGVCQKTFKSSHDLKLHGKTHAPDDKKYTHCCELCGRRFTQRGNLESHLRIHSGFKPYRCDCCGKTFAQKGNLDEHRRTHTGERPYVCEICGSAFIRRSEMKLHYRCAHTHERPYQCMYCPKNFQRRDLVRKHERIHTDTRPFVCKFCNKAFTQRDKLTVHTRLHTGERPYVCEVCGRGFCESGNLKKHLRVHGKAIPKVVTQNNKGRPAPNASQADLQKHLMATTAAASAVTGGGVGPSGNPSLLSMHHHKDNEESEMKPPRFHDGVVDPATAVAAISGSGAGVLEDQSSEDAASERSITPATAPASSAAAAALSLQGQYAAAAAAAAAVHPLVQQWYGGSNQQQQPHQ